jgi:hypothetical protein
MIKIQILISILNHRSLLDGFKDGGAGLAQKITAPCFS